MSPTAIIEFLSRGGPALWAIAALSVLTVALILWRMLQFWALGVWRGQGAEAAVTLWCDRDASAGHAALPARPGIRARLARVAMEALLNPRFDAEAAERTRACRQRGRQFVGPDARCQAIRVVLGRGGAEAEAVQEEDSYVVSATNIWRNVWRPDDRPVGRHGHICAAERRRRRGQQDHGEDRCPPTALGIHDSKSLGRGGG